MRADETTPDDYIDGGGPTEFAAVPVEREAPAPIAADDDLPELGARVEGRRRPPRTGRRLLTWVLPAALLMGVTGWSLRELSGLGEPIRGPKRPSGTEATGTAAAPTGEAASAAAAVPAWVVRALGHALDREVLGVELVRVDASGTMDTIPLHRAIKGDTVTVINLWATWCVPCKDELPGLRAMFAAGEARGWGDRVRFVPIRMADSQDEILSRQRFAAQMPTTEAFLIDKDLGGGLRPALIEAGLMAEQTSLPVTLVLDCKERVRWYHNGEIKGAKFEDLGRTLDGLRAELKHANCKDRPRTAGPGETRDAAGAEQPAPETGPAVEDAEGEAPVSSTNAPEAPLEVKPTEAPPKSVGEKVNPRSSSQRSQADGCGDEFCAAGIENCDNCFEDCGCGAGECKQNATGHYFCKKAAM